VLLWTDIGKPGFSSVRAMTFSGVPLDGFMDQIEARRAKSFMVAFEYPKLYSSPLLYQLEVRVDSDVAGSATGYSKETALKKDPRITEIGGTSFSPSLPYDIGNPRFVYYSELQQEIERQRSLSKRSIF
jgi:hypothetical protein